MKDVVEDIVFAMIVIISCLFGTFIGRHAVSDYI